MQSSRELPLSPSLPLFPCMQKLLDFLDGKIDLQLDAAPEALMGQAAATAMPAPDGGASAEEPAAKRAKLAGGRNGPEGSRSQGDDLMQGMRSRGGETKM